MLKDLCSELDQHLREVAQDGLEAQPDSRSVGGYAESALLAAWPAICAALGVTPCPPPGRRSIFDMAFYVEDQLVGVDLRTKDLAAGRYSDGGICSVANLLTFLLADRGLLLIAEFAYVGTGPRIDFVHACSAPIHCLPIDAFRIENLGTGQVRLDLVIGEAAARVAWNRPVEVFAQEFAALALQHYERVERDARRRTQAVRDFLDGGELRLR